MQTRSHEPMFGGARGLGVALALAVGLVACGLERAGTSSAEPGGEPLRPELDGSLAALPPEEAGSAPVDATASPDGAALAQPPDSDGEAPSGPPSALDAGDHAGGAESGVGNAPDAGSPPAQTCRLEGAFSAEVSFDVEWQGTSLAGVVPLLRHGTGQLRFVVRLDMRGGAPSRARSLLTGCGSALPDFAAGNPAVAGERYAAHIPAPAWDQPTMPRWDMGWELSCRAPGCTLTSETVVATFGARASAQDVWPGRAGSSAQLVVVDHDDDGLVGITFLARGSDERDASGVPYAQMPVSATLASRATKVLLAFQIATAFQGQMDDCDSLSGRVMSGRVESRAVGCWARNAISGVELPCTDNEIEFTDQALPTWIVTGGTFRARRVAVDAPCPTVRAAWE